MAVFHQHMAIVSSQSGQEVKSNTISWCARYISSTGMELFRQKKSWILVQDFADDDRNAHDINPYDTLPRYSPPRMTGFLHCSSLHLNLNCLCDLATNSSQAFPLLQCRSYIFPSFSFLLFQIIFIPTVLVHVSFKWNLLLSVVYISHNFKPTYILYLDDDQLSLTQHPLKMS